MGEDVGRHQQLVTNHPLDGVPPPIKLGLHGLDHDAAPGPDLAPPRFPESWVAMAGAVRAARLRVERVVVIGLPRNRNASDRGSTLPETMPPFRACGVVSGEMQLSRRWTFTKAALAMLLAGCAVTPTLTPSTASSPSPGASATAAASPSPQHGSDFPLANGPDHLRVELVVNGLHAPTGITNAGDGTGRLFITEQAGRVRMVGAGGALDPKPFVNLTGRITAGGERGLLGLAFHPGFATNRRLFVDYT
ncbi:MAG: PQQ-dependent sugar dehydrogenase, partial [Chloroflexota bacterium]|nr:PQQ-dependent sugar dehydrogenase [Chloroflexota bacterium]